MHTPEDYILEALDMVSWNLADETAMAYAANQQAKLMAGCYDSDEMEGYETPDSDTNHH